MIEEVFTDLAPLAEKSGITLESAGDGVMTGSDTLIYRLLFNLTENAIRYNRPNGKVRVTVSTEANRRIRHRQRHTGAVSGQHLPAVFPCG